MLLIVVVVVVLIVVVYLYPYTPSSFSNKSHNSVLVNGSDEDGLII